MWIKVYVMVFVGIIYGGRTLTILYYAYKHHYIHPLLFMSGEFIIIGSLPLPLPNYHELIP